MEITALLDIAEIRFKLSQPEAVSPLPRLPPMQRMRAVAFFIPPFRSATALRTPPSAIPFQRDRQTTSCLLSCFLSPCIPMSSTFWSDACTYARNKPLPTRLEALHASCGATVRRPMPSLV